MNTSKKQFETIDEYIGTFPKEVQSILEKIRQTIRKAAPQAVESISYQMPAFKMNGRYLVYFAGWKNHVALYPIPSNNGNFRKELAPYVGGKGTARFQLDEPIPYALIEKIVVLLMRANLVKASKVKKKSG